MAAFRVYNSRAFPNQPSSKAMHLLWVKFILAVSAFLVLSTSAYSQSGRRGQTIVVPVPPPEIAEPRTPPAQPAGTAPVTAQKNEDYQCTEDGSLARILDSANEEQVDTSRKPDTPAQILAKPPPSYSKEARRSGIQGQVVLKVLLSSEGEISRIRVHRGLPAGLTENAIRAACKIRFKPAMNRGQVVSRWLTVEYVFRLAQSSIVDL
jgi:TonB family protein